MSKKPTLPSKFIMSMARTFYGKRYFKKQCTLTADCDLSKIKPPYIVVANHAGFADVAGLVMLLGKHNANFITSVTQIVKWPSLIKKMGILPKKQFTVDTSLIRDIRYVLDHGTPVAIFPEAKLSVVGTPNIIKPSIAKLIRLVKVPLVTVCFDGTYLHKPRWAQNKRFVPIRARVKMAVSPEEVGKLSVDEIHNRIVQNLYYDDYAYQRDNKIEIDVPHLTEGLENILYKCPNCQAEFAMTAHDNKLTCSKCGYQVEMDKYGVLSGKFSSVPDWYNWQAQRVHDELHEGTYFYRGYFIVEKLVGKNYVELGKGLLTHNQDGLSVEMEGLSLFYKRDTFYTLSFNNDYIYLPTQEAVYRLARTENAGCTAKLNLAVEQQNIIDEQAQQK